MSRVARPLARRHMPSNFSISLDAYTGRSGRGCGYIEGEIRIPEDFGPQQSMQGFEDTYRNIIDYIVRITYRIWEDREVEYIDQTYADDSCVFDDYGLQRGSAKIIQDTHHTTGAFSNIRLIADEVIWAGDDITGFHTSHRTLIRGTNDGDSKYGPVTGRDIDVLVIANCVAVENEIFLEHVLYNNSALLKQLGMDPMQEAIRLSREAPAGWPRDPLTWDRLRNSARPESPLCLAEPVGGFDPDRFARDTLAGLWNQRNFSLLTKYYEDGFTFTGATDRTFRGAQAYQSMMSELLIAFPDFEINVDEVYWMGNGADGYLTSERWSATGTHEGAGLYGKPTGRQVQIWGITQHYILDGRIQQEWMLFNELDLMMQLVAA